MLKVGTQVKVVRPIDNWPDCYIEPGETGTLTEIDKYYWWVKLDADHPELEEWDNKVQIWDWSDEEHPEWHPSGYLEPIK